GGAVVGLVLVLPLLPVQADNIIDKIATANIIKLPFFELFISFIPFNSNLVIYKSGINQNLYPGRATLAFNCTNCYPTNEILLNKREDCDYRTRCNYSHSQLKRLLRRVYVRYMLCHCSR